MLVHFKIMFTYGPRSEKTCLQGGCEQQRAYQPAHLCSLISAFVIPLLECIQSRHTTSEISYFRLVSVAEQAALNLTFSEPPVFSRQEPYNINKRKWLNPHPANIFLAKKY